MNKKVDKIDSIKKDSSPFEIGTPLIDPGPPLDIDLDLYPVPLPEPPIIDY